jgi:hypothetical protein
MNKQKFYLLIFIFCLCESVSAQEFTAMTLAYAGGPVTITPYSFTRTTTNTMVYDPVLGQQNVQSTSEFTNVKNGKLKGIGNLQFRLEHYSKNTYMDLGFGWAFNRHLESDKSTKVKDRQGLEGRFAAGAYIGKYVGIMGGIQFGYTAMKRTSGTGQGAYSNNIDHNDGSYVIDIVGGAYAGLGGHLFIAPTDKIMIRVSYMRDRFHRMQGKEYNGIATTPEFAIYYQVSSDEKIGVFAKLNLHKRVIPLYQGSDPKNTPVLIPEVTTKATWLAIGFMISSLGD